MNRLRLYIPLPRSSNFFESQAFGKNLSPLYKQLGMLGHNGIDYVCISGTPVYAAHEGMVTYAGVDSSGGWGVVIRTNEAFDYENGLSYFKSIYWHLLPNIVC